MPRSLKHALHPAAAITAALALALTGCSKGSSQPELDEGPLSKYLGALYSSDETSEEEFAAKQQQVEELTAECMQKEGFEYTPDPGSSGGMVTLDDSQDDDVPDWGSKEFAEQYGYGVVNSPWATDDDDGNGDEYVDANQEYVDSLSESEQAAYWEALYGPDVPEEELDEDGSYAYDWTTSGCSGAANHEVSGEATGIDAAYEDPEFTELFEALSEVWNTEDNDAVNALNGEWAACMADGGYPDFATPDDAQMSISDKFSELWVWDDESTEGAEPQEPSKADTEALAAEEIELAVADYDCKAKLHFDKKTAKIQHDLEQAFVDEHKAELDAMLAKYSVSSDSKSKEK